MAPNKYPTYSDGNTPRVAIIGAGFSGICAAIQLKLKLSLRTFVIFEKSHDVGGVWLSNTYPGCQVDLPAWLYSYSFQQNPKWSKLCPDREEIWAYMQNVAKKYDLYSQTQFDTSVRSCVWEEETKTWTLITVEGKTKREQVHSFNIVIIGTGYYREPNYPAVFNTFSGPIMHSADWNANVRLENQIVGVVGASSSAVQVIPSIAARTKKLIVYMREASYVVPKDQLYFGWLAHALFTVCGFLMWILRGVVFVGSEFIGRGFNAGDFFNKLGSVAVKLQIRRAVKNKSMRQLLTPKYTIGYKIYGYGFKLYYQTQCASMTIKLTC